MRREEVDQGEEVWPGSAGRRQEGLGRCGRGRDYPGLAEQERCSENVRCGQRSSRRSLKFSWEGLF